MLGVLDHLAAMELVLLQKPVISGRYTGAAYRILLHPMDATLR